MGIAGQVGEDLLRTAEGAFCINEPIGLPQWAEVGLEGCCVGKMLIVTTAFLISRFNTLCGALPCATAIFTPGLPTSSALVSAALGRAT
jgi:hypothetical protein